MRILKIEKGPVFGYYRAPKKKGVIMFNYLFGLDSAESATFFTLFL